MERKIIKIVGVIILIGGCLMSISESAGAKTIKPGFTYTTLSNKIKKKITGVSFHKNKSISYKDLRYIKVKYYNFNGKVKKGELIVNKKIAKKVTKIFYELYKMKYPIQSIKLVDEYGGSDDKSMAANNSSAFNFRTIAGSNRLSKHAMGLAVDINPKINPYVVGGKVYPASAKAYMNRNRKTSKGKYRKYMILRNDKIVKLFKKYGFEWGGDWKSRKDYQHFEYVK